MPIGLELCRNLFFTRIETRLYIPDGACTFETYQYLALERQNNVVATSETGSLNGAVSFFKK